jgi:hypothetical protein
MDIKHLILNSPKKWVIDFKDEITFEDRDEFLKRLEVNSDHRYYRRSENGRKFEQLLEYYKFHIDLPRVYIKRVGAVSNYFYDKKK